MSCKLQKAMGRGYRLEHGREFNENEGMRRKGQPYIVSTNLSPAVPPFKLSTITAAEI